MLFKSKAPWWLVMSSLLTPMGVLAEDIDLFMADPSITGGGPNVVFVIDNGASWSASIGGQKKEEMVLESLHYVLTQDEMRDKVNLGLMPFAHGNSPKGGTVLVHAAPLDAARQATLSCRLYTTSPGADGICPVEQGKENIDKGNNSPYALTLNEAYRYFSGLSPMSGLQDGVYSTSNTNGYDPAAVSAGKYNSPAHENPCVSNYIIVIGTGDPDNGENKDAEAELKTLGGWLPSDPIALTEDQFESSWGDEFTRFIASADIYPQVKGTPSIVTYVIDVYDPNSNQSGTKSFKGARAFYQSMANQGRGKYFSASTKEQVAEHIINILEEIQSVNTVFASVSLPISVNVQGTNHNQVYIGQFRPDNKRVPRWVGNLKRYQYEFNDLGEPYLAGKDGQAAYNPATGFITQTAVSYWTEDSSYWAFHDEYEASDSPDGEIVEKGAAAQRLRERTTDRSLLTCTGVSCGASTNLETFAASNAAVSAVLSNDVINWVKGQDIQDENVSGTTTDRRPSIHGDVLHSRPAVVNYHRNGEEDDGEDVVIFYGSNDGIFRAVEGKDGKELWGFIPKEHFSAQQVIYDNEKPADNAPWRPYFVDGNTTIFSKDVNKDGRLKSSDGDEVYLYMTMRRGGRMIYALDVSTPESPKMQWSKTHSSTGFAELGQTWSTPATAYIKAKGSEPVLIFGLGYDSVEDNVKPLASSRSMGRGIMIVDAKTGTPLWQAGPNPTGAQYNLTVNDMTYAIPSEVRLINRSGNADNYAEFIYVGDTGGNVWRVDIRNENPDNWTVDKLASVGGCGADDCRKFLYPPSIVFGDDYDHVLIGSGDREKPFDKSVENHFYGFRDYHGGTMVTVDDLLDVSDLLDNDAIAEQLAEYKGWYIVLEEGEKVVGHALTLGGTSIFHTNLPASPNWDGDTLLSCESSLGTAREYYVNFETGGWAAPGDSDQRFATIPGGGFPPPPVSMTLINPETGLPWTGTAGLNPISPGQSSFGRRSRTFWYNQSE